MNFSFYLGIIAAVLTTAAFVPQVVKAHKTKRTSDLSLIMYITFSLGVFLWIIYGFIISSFPVIIANAAILILSLYVLILKIKHG